MQRRWQLKNARMCQQPQSRKSGIEVESCGERNRDDHRHQFMARQGKFHELSIGPIDQFLDCGQLPICFSQSGDADRAVQLKLAPGSLHFDVAIGNESRAYLAIDSIRAGAMVFAGSIHQRSFEVIAHWTVHNFPFRSGDRPCGT
jgi:hypothetical protein